MFNLDKNRMLRPGAEVSKNGVKYTIESLDSAAMIVKDSTGKLNSVKRNEVTPVINAKTLEAVISELDEKILEIDDKLKKMDKLKVDGISRIDSYSIDIISISEEEIPFNEKMKKISDFLKNVKQFETGDHVKVISNKKKHNLVIGEVYRVVKATNPLTVTNDGVSKQNIFKSEVEVIDESREIIEKKKSILVEDKNIYEKIHRYIKESEVDDFNDAHYLSWFIVDIMNSDKNDSDKKKEIAMVLNSSFNKINIEALKAH